MKIRLTAALRALTIVGLAGVLCALSLVVTSTPAYAFSPDADHPAVGQNQDGRLEIFEAAGSTGHVLHNWQTCAGCGWHGWADDLGDPLITNNVAVASNTDGRLEVFGIGQMSGVFPGLEHNYQNCANCAWHGWSTIDAPDGLQQPGYLDEGLDWNYTPAVIRDSFGRLNVFIVHRYATIDGVLVDAVDHFWQTCAGCAFNSTSEVIGGATLLFSAPLAVGINTNGALEVFGRAGPSVVHVWQTCGSCSQSGWSAWSHFPTDMPVAAEDGPSVDRNADGQLEVFERGSDNALWRNAQNCPGCSWGGWSSFGGSFQAGPTATHNSDGRLEVFLVGGNGAVWHVWENCAAPCSKGWSGPSAFAGGGFRGVPGVGMNLNGSLEIFVQDSNLNVEHKWECSCSGGWSGWDNLGGGSL